MAFDSSGNNRSTLFDNLIQSKVSSLKKWLTVEETAAYLGRSVGAIRNLAYRGKLTKHKFSGRVYFSREQLDRAIESSIGDYNGN